MNQQTRRTGLRRRIRTKLIAVLGGAILALILSVILGLSYETSTRFRSIENEWTDYSKISDARGIWISEIRGYLGYGGMIHNFKNYVLRQDEGYAETLYIQTDLLLKAIDAYLNSNPEPLEQKALARIRRVVVQYLVNIERITTGIRQGLSTDQLDALVRVDDTDALLAMRELEQHWRDQRKRSLSDILAALSHGNTLVHNLAWVIVSMTVLVGFVAVLFSILTGRTLSSNAAQIKELQARKQAQEEERKLAWVVQQSPTSILITDTNGKIEFVNKKLLEMTGYQEAELIGHTPNILKSGHTNDATYAALWKNLSQGKPWFGVFKNLHKDGSHYWASTSLLPLLDDDGNITNYIGVGEDITEKRRVDAQIAQVQKMEAVGILAGSVAHDFNNVLMAIIGNTELLKLEAEEMNAGSEVSMSLEQIEIASRRARALIQQLLTFARKQPGQARRISLPDAIREVLELIGVSTPPSIQVDLKVSDETLATDIDPTALFQIIMNLCQNAVEAIDDKAGLITVTLEGFTAGDERGLADLPRRAVGTNRITISDNGPGIPLQIQERIFEPFFSTKPVGTGLGLAIVQNWIEDAQGQVTVESSRENGTTFTLLVPQFELGAAQDMTPAQLALGHEHVMLVDDEEPVLYTIRRMMARLGYQVEAFTDPALALQAFADNPNNYDLVVTDMMMPLMGGDELLVALREIRADIPALIISSYHAKDSLPPSLADVQKLGKPINLSDLAQALRQVIDDFPTRGDGAAQSD